MANCASGGEATPRYASRGADFAQIATVLLVRCPPPAMDDRVGGSYAPANDQQVVGDQAGSLFRIDPPLEHSRRFADRWLASPRKRSSAILLSTLNQRGDLVDYFHVDPRRLQSLGAIDVFDPIGRSKGDDSHFRWCV